MILYNKLVRDKIPEIIKTGGENPIVTVLDKTEYIEALNKKLIEEVNEYQESKDIEELADILEVICAICETKEISFEQLQSLQAQKRKKRGGFSKRLFLIGKD